MKGRTILLRPLSRALKFLLGAYSSALLLRHTVPFRARAGWLVLLPVLVAVASASVLFTAGTPDRARAVTCPATMTYGETIDCFLSAPGEIDSYSFSGTSGDRVVAKMTDTSGPLNPRIRVYRPDGSLLCTQSGGTVQSVLESCALDATGTHSLRADSTGSGTGNYMLYLQRGNSPVGATASGYGNTHSAALGLGEMDAYTFSGTSGERIFVKMTDASTPLNPKVRVYRPNGTVVCTHTTGPTVVALLESCLLDATGVHAVLVDDWNASSPGNYVLHIQRPGSPVGGTNSGYGNTHTANLPQGDADAYTFSGTSGERIFVKMTDASTPLNPKVRVYRPDGTVVCQNTTSPTVVDILETCLLDATGTHAVLADDRLNGSGDYVLHIQRPGDPVGATTSGYGNTHAATLSVGDADAYTFGGASGERVLIKGADAGPTILKVRVYRPNGTIVCSAGPASVLVIDTCLLDATGSHAILVDDSGNSSGDYGLHIQRPGNPGGATPMIYGDTRTGTLALAEMDAYTFSGAAAERILVQMQETSPALIPRVQVYRPDGTKVCTAVGSAYEITIESCALDTSGTHTIIADDSLAHSGGYGVHVQRPGNPVGATAISYGGTIGATLDTAAETDAYTFFGTAGARVLVRAQDVQSTPNIPQLRIYRSNGTIVCGEGSSGVGSVEIAIFESCLLDSTGNHTITVDDFGQDSPGSAVYYLHLQRTDSPVNATPLPVTCPQSLALGEMKAYTIDAPQGGVLKVHTYEPNHPLYPCNPQYPYDGPLLFGIHVYRPDGTLRCSQLGGAIAAVLLCPLDQAGTYLIEASDWNLGDAGEFDIYAKVSPPGFEATHPTADPTYPTAWVEDPVNVVTGDFFHTNTDISVPTKGVPLEFTRYYHSGSTSLRGLGYGWSHTYDMHLEFPPGGVTVFYADGHAVVFNQSGDSYVPRSGVYDSLVRNGDGTYTLKTSQQIRYNFSSAGALTSILDRNDNGLSLTYSASQLTVSDGQQSLVLEYFPGSTLIRRVTDPLSRTVEFTYTNDDLTAVKDVKGGTTSYVYNSHRIETITDSNDHIDVRNFYDGRNRVVEQHKQVGPSTFAKTCFYYWFEPTYNSQVCPTLSPGLPDNQTLVVDARGNKTTYTHDASFRTTEIKDHLNGTIQYSFDATHNVTCVTDQLGRKTGYQYDSSGNLTQVADANNTDAQTCDLQSGGKPWVFTYNSRNDISSQTDPLLRFTDYVYDDEAVPPGKGNLTRIIRRDSPSGPIRALTCFERNASGLVEVVVESTDLLPGEPTGSCTGNRTLHGYDEHGNLTCTVNPRNYQPSTACGSIARRMTLQYDLGGRMLFATDELTNEFRPPVNQPEIGASACGNSGMGNGADNDGDGVADDGCPSRAYTYDEQNNVLTEMDELGNLTTHGYDSLGQKITLRDANRNTPTGSPETACGTYGTGDGFDSDGDTVVDDGCLSTKWFHDEGDRLAQVVEAAFASSDPTPVTVYPITSYEYDLLGNRISATNAKRQAVGAPEAGTACSADADWDGNCDSVDLDDDNDGVNDTDEINCGSDSLISNIFPERKEANFAGTDENANGVVDEDIAVSSYDCDGDGYSSSVEAGAPLCSNAVNDDSHDDALFNDGCPSVGTAETDCVDTPTSGLPLDDDGDGFNNDGCPQSGSFSEGQFNIGTAPQARCGVVPPSTPSPNWPSDLWWGGTDTSRNRVTIQDISSFVAPIRRLDTKPGDADFSSRWDLIPGPSSGTEWITTEDMDALTQGPTSTPPMFGGAQAFNGPSCTMAGASPLQAPGSGNQCGPAGTGDGVDDDIDGVADDGCPSARSTYDQLNRLAWSADALGRVSTHMYDAASNLIHRRDPRGFMTRYIPDSLDRADLIQYWNLLGLAGSVDYAYDDVGNRVSMADATGTTHYEYDSLNRVVCSGSVIIVGPCPSGNVAYQYDTTNGVGAPYPGQRTKITYPDPSKTATYTYEADGRMESVTDWSGNQTEYSFDPAGRLTKTEYKSGGTPFAWTDYGYDSAERLTSVSNNKAGPATISSFTYTLDAVGNRRQMVDLSGIHTYQFDPLYRLTQVTYPGPETDTYTYDAHGNRLTKNATTYTYDAADQMTATGGLGYVYDGNGNQTGRGSDSFTYDHENRLTQSIVSGATSSSQYNGDGLRMSHTVNGQTTNYTWDIAAQLPVVLQDGTNTYLYGLDLISATDSNGVQSYYLYDGLGSTANTIDAAGTTTFAYSYDVFGAIRSQTPPGGSNSWLFTGEQRDTASSLYYLRARYYDPSIGRFLTRDSKPGHPYVYALNNPVTFTDPNGESIRSFIRGLFGGGRGWTGVRIALSVSPIIGDVNDAIAVATGYDIIWGERISREERALYAAGLLFGSGSMYRRSLGLGGESTHLVSKADYREIVERSARDHASKGRAHLKRFLTRPELERYELDPDRGSRFLGQAMHRAVKEDLDNLGILKKYHSNKGPDFEFYNGDFVELTTSTQEAAHADRYPGIPIATYSLPGK